MGNCAGKPKKPEEATSKPAPAKVEESKPVQPKLKEEDDPNSPFFRGPRPDPPKPAPAKPATPENQKVTADVHEAEVVDSKGCSALIPDVPAPCSTTCEVEEEAVNVPQDQVEDKELELPTRPSRVSFTQGEKSEDDAHPIARTPTPVAVEEVRVSQEEEDEPVREPTPKTFTPEPVREPTPKPVTPEPVQEITRSRTSSGSASISTCSSEEEVKPYSYREEEIIPSYKQRTDENRSDYTAGATFYEYKKIQHDQEIADFVEATSAPAVETARQEVQNIEIEDVIEDDIIQPIHRQYSEKGASDKISGATLEEYRSKIDADAGDVGDEIAKALEELESAQTALDHTKHISDTQDFQDKLNKDLEYLNSNKGDERYTSKDKGMNLFNRRKDRCEEYTVEIKPREGDKSKLDMFNMKKDYANWNGGVDIPTSFNTAFQGVPEASKNKDSEFERKLRERQMAMDERGQIGQKLGGTRGRNRSGSRDRESSRERPPKSASRDNLYNGSQSDLYERPSSRNDRPSSRTSRPASRSGINFGSAQEMFERPGSRTGSRPGSRAGGPVSSVFNERPRSRQRTTSRSGGSRRGSTDNPDHMIDTDLLRSDPKIYHKKVLGDKETKNRFDYSTYAGLKRNNSFTDDTDKEIELSRKSNIAAIEEQDACVSDRIEEWQSKRGESHNMNKNNLYDHNVYQKQEYKVNKVDLSPKTKEKRHQLFSGQPSTGVELRKKMNDDFQDFIDFVDPIIKNPIASNEALHMVGGSDRPDPEREDLFARKCSSSSTSPMPRHFGEASTSDSEDKPKYGKSERKIGNQSYKELAALPNRKQL